MVIRIFLACWCALSILGGASSAGDFVDKLPFNLGFQLGFAIRVVPSRADLSGSLGLGVAVDKVYSDKQKMLSVTGTITNYSTVPVEDVAMAFAVNSYIETGFSRGRAEVAPSTITPGGTATFSAYIFLQSEKPKFAMYTITGRSPLVPDEGVTVEYPQEYFPENGAEVPDAGPGDPAGEWSELEEIYMTDEDLRTEK
ncbi:MAG: hypothetical protein LIQ31_06380 [Planctomycetes bacterium]|nr:hypothetical protein [Planctomycetota bacterium]